MKKANLGITAIVAIAGALALSGPAAAEETIKLTTQDWAPYQVIENGQLGGVAVKVVQCIMGKLNTKADIEVLPWTRAQKTVQDGAAQGFFTASKSEERDAYAEMSKPIVPQVWRWYLPSDSAKDVKAKDIKAGVLAGSSMQKWLDDNGYTNVQKLNTTDALIKLLQSGRIDGILANEMVFKHALQEVKLPESTFKSELHSDRPLGIYFSKAYLTKNPGFLDKFNAQIPNCPASM